MIIVLVCVVQCGDVMKYTMLSSPLELDGMRGKATPAVEPAVSLPPLCCMHSVEFHERTTYMDKPLRLI